MGRKFVVLSILVVLVLGLLIGFNVIPLFGLSESKETIKLGAILPLVGNLAYQGNDIQKGIDFAIEEINLNGGINGHKLEVVYDDYANPALSYQNFASKGVKIFLTSYGDTTLKIAPIAESEKNIVFSIGGGSPKVSDAGDFIFRHNVLPQDETKTLTNKIYSDDYTEIGAVVINTESGNTYFDNFKKEFESLGGKVVIAEKIGKEETNFTTVVAKIKNSNVKALFYISGVEQLDLINQLKSQGVNLQIYSGYFFENSKVFEILGKNAEGIIYTHFFNTETDNAKAFAKKFYAKYGVMPNPFSALAYDNVYMLKDAIEKCDNVNDSVCIKNNLYKVQIDGVTGKTYFDKNGDTIKQIYLKVVRIGEFVLLK